METGELWLSKASVGQGFPAAMCLYADLCIQKEEFRKAFGLATMAAKLKYPPGLTMLSECFRRGIGALFARTAVLLAGVPFKFTAPLFSSRAILYLPRCTTPPSLAPAGVPHNRSKAAVLLEEAADLGDAAALWGLAELKKSEKFGMVR